MLSRRHFLFLTSAALASAGIASTPPSPDPSAVVNDAIQAAGWVAQALSASGYRADFSLGSFAELDRFLDDQAPGGVARPDGLLSENLGSRLFAIGSYVGETLRRRLGGAWVGDDNDPQAEINLALKLPDGTLLWPVQRVMKRFKNGREDGLAAYAAALSRAQ
jgi:hypothetical protein